MKTVIFLINGGIGKNIAGTAVVQNIKNNHPDRKIIVFCSYPEVFLNNPNIYRVYSSRNVANFYENFIKNKDVLFFGQDIYNSHQFVVENKHMIQSWCELFNLKYYNEMPKIYLSDADLLNINKYKKNKPIFLLQSQAGNEKNYNWVRDIPFETTQKLINIFKDKYSVFYIRAPNQFSFPNTEIINTNNIREIICLLTISNKRLLVNSFLQHASAALNTSSVVYWIYTDPKKYGYLINKNIQPDDINQDNLNEYNYTSSSLTLDPGLCNLNLTNYFNIEKIINNLK